VLPAHQSSRAARHGGAAHFSPHALNAALHRLCDKLEGRTRRFTPHDLRSTGRSHLSALGVSLIVAERCLNHSLGGLVATYDQHDYLTERRAALGRLAEFVAACEQGRGWQPANNVAPMRPVAA
jgi:integrase